MSTKTFPGVIGMCLSLGLARWSSSRAPTAAKPTMTKLIAALDTCKLTLETGIRQAASKSPEAAISAKFELEEKGDLSLSVYTAEKGLAVDAEHNVLKELSGGRNPISGPRNRRRSKTSSTSRDPPSSSRSWPSQDVAHGRDPEGTKNQAGTVYSVTPRVRDRKAVFVVMVADKRKPVELVYDATTGAQVKK